MLGGLDTVPRIGGKSTRQKAKLCRGLIHVGEQPRMPVTDWIRRELES